MDVPIYTLEEAGRAADVVVVVDVLRAFTTAAFAFAAGVRSIALVETPEDAWALKSRFPDALLMGEVNGRRIPGFDFGNSPEPMADAIETRRLAGVDLIQRTTHGTQGVIRCGSARAIFVASMVIAGATADAVRDVLGDHTEAVNTAGSAGESRSLSFISTGTTTLNDGDEDRACAEYILAMIRNEAPSPSPYLDRVRQSSWAAQFHEAADGDFPARDLDRCCELNRFHFALEVKRTNSMFVLVPRYVNRPAEHLDGGSEALPV